jgi:phosphatidylglycerophosphatase A
VKKTIIKFFATGFFTGYSPIIPGTVGSIVGVILYLIIYYLFYTKVNYFWIYYTFGLIIFCSISIWICSEAEAIFNIKDARYIVLDEIAGYLVTMIGISPDWRFVIGGFILFRLLDIIKPYPLYSLQQLHRGFGIMMDDIGCGLIGCGILHIINIFYLN